MRRRPADRVAGIRAEADLAEVGGDSGGRTAARAGGNAIECVGILGVSGQNRVHGLVRTERELRHIGFGEYDRARLPNASHEEGIFVGYETLHRQRTGRGRKVDSLEVVLDDDGNAVQWPGETLAPEADVE